MADLDKLQADYEDAEKALYALDAEYQDKRDQLREKYQARLSKLGEKAAAAQKTLCDAEAAAALVGRDDAETVAENLGISAAFHRIDPRNAAIIKRNTSDGVTDWEAVESEIAERELASAQEESASEPE